METIKVNMNPNPLDVQTIHASQNDGEARQWGFELHNNGDVIDSSEVTDQITFKAYKGGTEELLPSSLMNGSVDLGSLEWTAVATATSGVYRMRSSGISADVMKPSANNVKANAYNSRYSTITASESYQAIEGIAVEPNGNLFIYDSNYNTSSSATEFKDSLQGVFLWYEKSDSTPTTSPFLCGIKYPQGLLTNQEFTYRQSPTEEDGLAKITDIKGNTLNWNQLQQSASASQTINGIAYTVNNDGSITANGTATETSIFYLPQIGQLYANHKYLVKGCPSGGTAQTYMLTFRCNGFSTVLTNEVGNGAIANGQNYIDGQMGIRIASGVTLNNAKFYPQVFDLTKMELDSITDPSDFTSLFSLPYYAYNQGTLLSFNGNVIKTVGKNLWDNSQLIRGIYADADFNSTSSQVFTSIKWYGFANTTYTVSWGIPVNVVRRIIDGTHSITTQYNNIQTFTLTPSKDGYIGLSFRDNTSSTTVWNTDTTIQIEVGSTATAYEPYASSTTSLPTSTYFPTGMKSVPSAYDELTPNKAITRVGMVDLGSLTYVKEAPSTAHPDWPLFYASVPNALGRYGAYGNTQICAKYSNRSSSNWNDKTIGFGAASTNINIADSTFADYTVDQVKQALSGVMLFYQFATPTETSFTTASLVTENAEIPLSNEDGVLIGKCTEQLSSESGFFDAKIKLADEDGECYSNKIQLHIERSPQ